MKKALSGQSLKGGGRTRARTWDPLIKSQLLYQLSYAPERRSMPCEVGRLAKRSGDGKRCGACFPRLLPQARKCEKPLDSSGFAKVNPRVDPSGNTGWL